MELPDLAITIAAAAIKWLIYTALLWAMIKVQKLNYNVLGLFGSSLLSILVSFIPFAGPYLSYVVLVICLWKCTGAEIAPDIVFTVGIAGALMFCVNLYLIGTLMGHFRPDFAHNGTTTEQAEAADDDEEDTAVEGTPAEEPHTNAVPAPRPHSRKLMPVQARTSAPSPAPTAPTVPTPAPAPKAPPVIADGPLTIKGISRGGHPSVLISDGNQVYTVSRGDSFTASLPETGRVRIKCEDITLTSVVLRNGQGQTFQLRLP